MKKEISLRALSRSFILSFGAAGGIVAAPGTSGDAGGMAAIVRRRAIHIVTLTDASLAGDAVRQGVTAKCD